MKQSLFWIACWSFGFTLAMTFNKVLSQEGMSSGFILVSRAFWGAFFLTPFFVHNRRTVLKSQHPWLQLLRIGFLFSAMLCTYYTYRTLPLFIATAIGFTGPLFVAILSVFILHEKISPTRWGLIMLGYAGVLILINPFQTHLQQISYLGILSSLATNIFGGCAAITLKKVSDDSISTIMIANSVGVLFLSLLWTASWGDLNVIHHIRFEDFALLSIVALFGVLSQVSFVRAIKLCQPSFVAPFEYTRILLSWPIGVLFFKEHVTWNAIIGCGVIIISTISLARISYKTSS